MGIKVVGRIGQLVWVAALVGALMAGCGGGGGHHDDGGTTGGETTGTTTGGTTTGGTTTGGETTGGTTLSCADAYTPEKVGSEPDGCKPQAGTVCPVADSTTLIQHTPIACDGVSASEYTVQTSSFTSTYYALTTSNRRYDAIYVGLHYLFADKSAFINIVRLQELAKARKVLVLAPQAPSLTPLVSSSRWPTGTLLDSSQVEPTIEWLTAVVEDARDRYGVDDSVPVYVAGLSNGAVMSYLFGCKNPDVRAVLAVSSDSSTTSLDTSCSASHPLGTVIVHGTNDLVTPYDGVPLLFTMSIPGIHAYFNSLDGCNTADASVSVPQYFDSLGVTISYTPADRCAYRNFLVTVDGGGHNWPGLDKSVNLGTILFGAHTANFDATLQGYDLLKLAAGDD
ncbi:alpha/beta hydrolase family esterase [Solimonas soli]|uniref:alpha/beta hydrolase family esterase n=1 Tax=Solimonas soli TaxID=413479 RepID=UPI0004AE1E56|nr:hypothetical protein [Solimonas soli]